PPIGYLLGAVNGRTFTGDTSQSGNLERSTALIDHTFVKAQRDNGYPAATYVVEGNSVTPCAVTASPTPSPTVSPTATATASPTATATATASPTATATATASPTATATATA